MPGVLIDVYDHAFQRRNNLVDLVHRQTAVSLVGRHAQLGIRHQLMRHLRHPQRAVHIQPAMPHDQPSLLQPHILQAEPPRAPE